MTNINYRWLIGMVLLINTAYGSNLMQSSPPFLIEEATILSTQHAFLNHSMTCEVLIKHYLNRIKQFDLSTASKPPLNAITEINASVLNQARKLDSQFSKTHQLAGPLHCIPVLVKDNIDALDSTTTTGSFALLGSQPIQDAFLVKQLRKAGAVILGHGAMDEFAMGMYGISSRSGRTGNAYDTLKSSGGSSGGVAAAVSANFTMVGIGTDNSGSVRIPAAFNGLVGLRPSTGLISQNGIFPMGNLDGTPGPLTRTVTDLAILMDVLAQPDLNDKKTLNLPHIKTYTAFLKKDGLQNKRIGIIRHVGSIDTFKSMPIKIQQLIVASSKKMQSAGAIVIDQIDLPKFDTNRKFNMAGIIEDINQYLSAFPSTRQNFQDICESNRTRSFGNVQHCLKFMKSMPSHNSRAYSQALAIFEKNRIYVEEVMKKNQLDALYMPLSKTGGATYDPLAILTWQASVASNAGLPAITMNIGSDKGMPVGIELIGKKFDEGTLIEIAYSYEQHSHPRVVPKLPEVNQDLLHLSIPQFNNLLTIMGADTYETVLKNGKTGEFALKNLTAKKFTSIVNSSLLKLQAMAKGN